MLPELRYELLFFCTRDELERLQPFSQTLRDMIVAGANVLPLRPVSLVDMGYDQPDEKIAVFVEGPSGGAPVQDYTASTDDGDFAEIILRLQHTCIEDFCIGISDSPFLRYWKAHEAASFAVVSIDFGLTDDTDDTDYDVLDSIVNHLRPRTTEAVDVEESFWHENGYDEEKLELLTRKSFLKLELLTRESFLNNLHTCRLVIWDEAFPPPSFIFKEPGYTNYELACVCWCDGCQVADGIDGFLASFVRDGCANRKLESVCVQWDDGANQPSPALKQLKKPTKTDVPLPKNYLTAFLATVVHRVTQCEMHSLVNVKQCKRMELHKWTVEYDESGRRWTTHILLCRIENL